ncbi:hypothetical protein MA16_Dca007729 [Dendrobium catenatum]|uniref:Uncharacterized protein n=1 Tax=Dendrobium catenatum TaxID=906689 RepID=A0A2I0X559_9ASPA|nr:hypothetical protein MA16_Dca007729 [Dendrobium catenatum]
MVISLTYHLSFPLRPSSCIQGNLVQGKIRVPMTHFAKELQCLGPITNQQRKWNKKGGGDDSHGSH